MRTRLPVALAVVVAVMFHAWPASAKGPSEGTIEGDGIDAPIVIGFGEGTPSGDRLIDAVGFFPAVFEQTPDPMLDAQPTPGLGPELTLSWTVPGPDGEIWEIVQLLYPYADGGPLVYTDPGQLVFEGMRTRGGWFRAPDRLITMLGGIGVPTEDELTGAHRGIWTGWPFLTGASLVGMVLLGACLGALVGRWGSRAGADPEPSGVPSAAG